MPELNENPAVLIDWFDDFGGPNPYAFLSNFYREPVRWGGEWWATAEHAFHAAKMDLSHPDGESFYERILTSDDPGVAKMLGRTGPMRADWEEVKFEVMREVVAAKFAFGSDLAARLEATGDAYLQEGTFWGDDCWGVLADEDVEPHLRRGRNWLGIILMERRAANRLLDRLASPVATL